MNMTTTFNMTILNTTSLYNLSTTTESVNETSTFSLLNTTEMLNDTNYTTSFVSTSAPLSSASCSVLRTIKGYRFPPAQPGIISYSEESCPDAANGPEASILCSNDGTFDEESLKRATCQSIAAIIDQPYTNVTFETLQFATANISSLTNSDVGNIARFLQNISNLDTRFSEEQVTDAAEIFSHLTEHYRERDTGDSEYSDERQELVQSLGRISRKLYLKHSSEFSAITQDINVRVVDMTSFDSSYFFEASFYQTENSTVPFSPMTAAISGKALAAATSLFFPLRVVSVAFRSSALFPSPRTTGWVISASLGNDTHSVEGLSLAEPVVFESNAIEDEHGDKNIDQFKKVRTVLQCVFWDFKAGDWSKKGCSLLQGKSAACQCDHLTNFAVLVSRIELPADVALDILTYVGCGLSIAGLCCTFLIISTSRRLRKKYQMRILGNIALCLALALSLFLFGIDAEVSDTGCSVLTTFMQYFFLATWCWMAVYSYTIYRDIVQVMLSYVRSFKLHLASLFAYGVPLVIVVLNAGITLGHIDRNAPDELFVESSYRAENFCWLRHHSLYFGFILPIALLLVFNITVFSIVIPKVTCRKDQIQSSKSKRGTSQNVIMSVSLATTMGLSWIFGYLMLVSDNASYLSSMSWLFTLVNSFQGVFIFYFSAIRTGEIRRIYEPISRRFSSTPAVSTIMSRSSVSSSRSKSRTDRDSVA